MSIFEIPTIDELFLTIDETLHEQFIACFDYFLESKDITADEYKSNEHLYIYDFEKLWAAHNLLLESDDKMYGRLVTKK